MTTQTHQTRTDFSHLERMQNAHRHMSGWNYLIKVGEIVTVGRTTLRAKCHRLGLGSICRIVSGDAVGTLTEIISIDGTHATLSVLGDAHQICVGDRIEYVSSGLEFTVPEKLLGSVLDGVGRPLSGDTMLSTRSLRAIKSDTVAALDRPVIDRAFQTGVPAIDCFSTLGQGQRIALFGAPGCGKSTLLASIISNCTADVVVIALVGERGREVQEFLKRHIPEAVRKKTVMVVATSDRPPLERTYAVHVASSIAEDFRDKGQNVLLVVDSLTRAARAYREIGLAAGEPAVRRGFPASVYPALPKIIERAGRTTKGSITAVYSVLVEGDSASDPIADEIKSLTDGHIELSREHADAGRFPAIDVVKSLSRVMPDVVGRDHMEIARSARKLLAKYEDLKLLIQIGEYQEGQDPEADEAIQKIAALQNFIHQNTKHRPLPIRGMLAELRKVLKK